MKGVFVAGTDTGVGKTLFSSLLCLYLRERGIDVGVMKPLETGVPSYNGVRMPQDASQLKACSGTSDPLELICPYCFEEPLAPAEAAKREGVEVDLGKILEAFEGLRRRHQYLVVEGVGGLLVPITSRVLLPELIKAMDLEVVLVGRSGLGTINHTLLSLYYCRKEGIRVKGFVLNRILPQSDPSEEGNSFWIETFSGTPYLGTIPYLGGVASLLDRKDVVLPLVEEGLRLDLLLP